MFLRNTQDIFLHIKSNPDLYILVAETPEVSSILIQDLIRDYKGQEIKFLALRNIELYEQFQRKGFFKKLVQCLLETERPIMLHDVINESIIGYILSLGFEKYIDHKNGRDLLCFVKI